MTTHWLNNVTVTDNATINITTSNMTVENIASAVKLSYPINDEFTSTANLSYPINDEFTTTANLSYPINDEYTYTEYDFWYTEPSVYIPLGLSAALFTLIGIIGNVLTIASFIRDKQLRIVYNYYIINMAVADLLICAVMSISTVYWFTHVWNFGYHWCKFWSVVDYVATYVAELCMIGISLDRCMLLYRGPEYSQKETGRKACAIIAGTWIFSFLAWGTLVIGWDHWTGEFDLDPVYCSAAFDDHFMLNFVMFFVDLPVNLTILVILNTYIVFQIRKRSRKVGIGRRPKAQLEINSNVTSYHHETEVTAAGADAETTTSVNVQSRSKNGHQASTLAVHMASLSENNSSPGVNATNGTSSIQVLNGNEKDTQNSKKKDTKTTTRRDIKAAKNLALILVWFLVTWTPFTIYAIFVTVYPSVYSDQMYEFLAWVMWIKSVFNPVLYAYTGQRFKENFKFFIFYCFRRSRNI